MVWNFCSRQRMFQELSPRRTFAPWNFRSRERKFQELLLPGTFTPWKFRSRERKFQEISHYGTFVPWNFEQLVAAENKRQSAERQLEANSSRSTDRNWRTMLKAQNLYSRLRVDPIQLTLLH